MTEPASVADLLDLLAALRGRRPITAGDLARADRILSSVPKGSAGCTCGTSAVEPSDGCPYHGVIAESLQVRGDGI